MLDLVRSSLKTGIKEKKENPETSGLTDKTENRTGSTGSGTVRQDITTQSIWEKLRSQPCYPRISDDLRLHPLPPCTSSGEPESELGVFFHTFLFSLTRFFQTLTMGGVACFLAFL